MNLNIKSPEAHELAQDIARQTGQSMTAVVVKALRRERQRIEREASIEARTEALMAIGRRCAEHLTTPFSATEHADFLYSECGKKTHP